MSTLFSGSLTTDADGWNGNTIVDVWNTSALTIPSGIIVQIRATFKAAAAQALTITNAYIGHKAASGDAYDFLNTPTQLLFGGGASGTASAAGTVTSDYVNFNYNKINGLIIAFYCGGGTSSDDLSRSGTITGVAWYFKVANEAALVDKTGYSTATGSVGAVSLIEVNTINGIPIVFFQT